MHRLKFSSASLTEVYKQRIDSFLDAVKPYFLSWLTFILLLFWYYESFNYEGNISFSMRSLRFFNELMSLLTTSSKFNLTHVYELFMFILKKSVFQLQSTNYTTLF